MRCDDVGRQVRAEELLNEAFWIRGLVKVVSCVYAEVRENESSELPDDRVHEGLRDALVCVDPRRFSDDSFDPLRLPGVCEDVGEDRDAAHAVAVNEDGDVGVKDVRAGKKKGQFVVKHLGSVVSAFPGASAVAEVVCAEYSTAVLDDGWGKRAVYG